MEPYQKNKKGQNLHYQKSNNDLDIIGKIPPQALEFEEATLGACMIDSEAYDKVSRFIRPEMFYKETHQTIYRAIEQLALKHQSIDLLTVTQQLRDNDKLDDVGGAVFIAQLTGKVGSAAHADKHAMIIYQMFVLREIIRNASNLNNIAFAEPFDDVLDHYAKFILNIDDLIAHRRTDKLLKDILAEHEIELQKRTEKSLEGGMPGIPTGLADLNTMTAGWQNGDLVVVGARPAMGKTALSLMFGKHAASQGIPVCYFSIEMDDVKLADRLICSEGGIDSTNLKFGKLTSIERQSYQQATRNLSRLPMWIDDNPKVTINSIRAIARTKHRRGECKMIIIDYLQLIESVERRDNNREREVAEISRSLKVLAKELNIPIIILCQLSRATESRGGDKKPSLSDLRESGAIEQDADVVLFPYRPEYYGITEDSEGTPLKGVGILIVAKNRQGGNGEVYFKYSPDLSMIFDLDKPF